MDASFRDSVGKRVVREGWDTPFLRHLNKRYGIRYRYMGFPGTSLIDVRLWRDMLDEVIAFELPTPGPEPRQWIRQLRTNLRTLGMRSVTYYGSLESVVVLGRDLDGQRYEQSKVITLYNLDFCDEITSRVDTPEGQKAWRFEALRTIVQDQHDCFRRSSGPSHFVILLTVRNQVPAKRIDALLSSSNPSAGAHQYARTCQRTKRIPQAGNLMGTHAWSIKTLLFTTLCNTFAAPNVSAIFFPLVKYTGTPISARLPSPMLHWIVLCRFGKKEDAAPAFFPREYLSSVTSIEVARETLVLKPEPGENMNANQPLESVAWFEANRPSSFDLAV